MTADNLQITDIAFGGKGVGRIDGKAVFVPYVVDGETVSARVVREHKKFIEAELETVKTTSPHRVEARCPYFGECGGCVYQHIDYEHQLAIKSRQVQQILARIGGISAPMRPIIPSPFPYEYRNRITVHGHDGVIGFFRRESNRLIDIERCPIARDEVNEQLAALRVRKPGDGHYALRENDCSSVFTQTNNAVAGLMLSLVEGLLSEDMRKHVPPEGHPSARPGTLIDAYCGAGFFAKGLRPEFEKVIGIDWDIHAIAQAKQNLEPNEEYIAGDVDSELSRLLENNRADAVIVDPPQTGLSRTVQAALNRHAPQRLIYVSCNPATLARDLAALNETFEIDSVTPLDMFPQTAEIETVAALHA
jgi:tRNA/tmRNA/rRNA uracil-C5-methylase (TrmA/RlmC/RlmD family)